MRCYDTWERRAVRLCGVRWGGAVDWRCSGLPDAPRRVAGFWCGRAGRPPPGMPTGGSGGPWRCGHFCMNSQPHRPPRLDARGFLPVCSTVAAFAGRLRLDSAAQGGQAHDKDDCRKRRRATGRRGLCAVPVARRCGRRNPPACGRRRDRHRGRRPLRRAFQHREGLRAMSPPRRAAGRMGDGPRGASGVGWLRRSSGTGGGPISPLVRGGPHLTGKLKNFSFSNFPFSRVPTVRLSKNF